MSIASEITRIQNNIAAAYTVCSGKGAALPQTQNSANLADTISGISQSENITWHQCPQAVRNYLDYMEQHPYPDNDYSYSNILTYALNPAVNANTKPVGKTIGSVTYYDNVPGVDIPFAAGGTSGTLRFADKLRWINSTYQVDSGEPYPRGANARDIGGWSCGVGRDSRPCAVKYGMLFRGGEPNAADRVLMVEKLGIKSELQLLPLHEQATDRKLKSVWGIDWYGNDTETSVYGIDNTETNKYLWKKFLGAVFNSAARGKPIYIHCGVGADRTGSVMIMLEAILGMTENEIAQDYELTNFAFYQDSTTPRRRNTTAYQQYMTTIKSVPLVGGLSDTFTNRAISFALSLGFTAAQINAYRNACTDGNPVQIAPTVTSYTVTKTGSHVTYSDSAASVDQFQKYETELTPELGYVITGVAVTMGGTDITAAAFTGTERIVKHSVSKTLSNSVSDNAKTTVIDGESYAANITPDQNYAISDITVLMGGTDITASAVALIE